MELSKPPVAAAAAAQDGTTLHPTANLTAAASSQNEEGQQTQQSHEEGPGWSNDTLNSLQAQRESKLAKLHEERERIEQELMNTARKLQNMKVVSSMMKQRAVASRHQRKERNTSQGLQEEVSGKGTNPSLYGNQYYW